MEIFLIDEKARSRELAASTPQAVQKVQFGPNFDIELFEWSNQRLIELKKEVEKIVI